MININYDKENKILKSCKPLEQYSLFVDAVRRHIKLDKNRGFENAIKECIKNDILRDYLQRKSKEVINMLIGEYNYETDIAVQRAEEHEIAFAQGSRQAKLETARNLRQFGLSVKNIATATGLSQEEVEALN